MNKPVYLGLSILKLSKYYCMRFGMIMQMQSMVKKQKCIIWIQTISLYT